MEKQHTRLSVPKWWEIGGRTVGNQVGDHPPYPLVRSPTTNGQGWARYPRRLRRRLDTAQPSEPNTPTKLDGEIRWGITINL